jgi:hypothetical protein
MQAFTIDAENNITVFRSLKETEGRGAGTETFASAQELAGLAAGWPGARLVEIWNGLPGVEPIRRFTSRTIGVDRIWKAMQTLTATGGVPAEPMALKTERPLRRARAKARPKPRQNTKTAQVIALLEQPEGATLKAIMKATGWLAHSVRGFVSGPLGKKMSLRIRSFTRDGERVYKLKA